MDIGVDFHGRLHKGMAKQLAKLLEPYQPLFIEGTWQVFSKVLSTVLTSTTRTTPPNTAGGDRGIVQDRVDTDCLGRTLVHPS